MFRRLAVIAALAVWAGAGHAAAETLRYGAALHSRTDVSPGTRWRGNALLSLDTDTNMVRWRIEHSGLADAPRTLGCGPRDRPSPAILVTSGLASPITGAKRIGDRQAAALRAGNWTCVLDSDDGADAIRGVLKPVQ
jgi:hypothetical protein